tara:strand:+ start:335 stop:694 length:360 start_codon:yes stop_codon:yes gene_type:complete
MAAHTFSTLMWERIAGVVSCNSDDWLSIHPSGHANREAVKTVMFQRTKAAERDKRLLQRLLTAYKRNVSPAAPTFATPLKGLRTFPLLQAKSTPQLGSAPAVLWKNCAKHPDQAENNLD